MQDRLTKITNKSIKQKSPVVEGVGMNHLAIRIDSKEDWVQQILWKCKKIYIGNAGKVITESLRIVDLIYGKQKRAAYF